MLKILGEPVLSLFESPKGNASFCRGREIPGVEFLCGLCLLHRVKNPGGQYLDRLRRSKRNLVLLRNSLYSHEIDTVPYEQAPFIGVEHQAAAVCRVRRIEGPRGQSQVSGT